ncbi:MAG TPA: cytochrome c biogenesis protein DipZ [Acidimicrobiales bacterium]|nr:cytochrome c biogenesis protein DipZ [Acidimicrobiales bacterium]
MLLLYVVGFVAGVVAGISPCILPVLPVVLVAGATRPQPAATEDAPDPASGADEGDASEEDGADTGEAASPRGRPVGVATAAGGAGAGSPRPLRSAAVVVRPAPRPTPARPAGRARRPPGGSWSAGAEGPGPDGGAARHDLRPYAVVAGLILSFSITVLVGSSILSALGLPQDFLRDAGLVVLAVVAVGLIVPPVGELIERPFARLAGRQPSGTTGGFVLGLSLGVLFVPCAGPVLTAITVVSAHHTVGLGVVVLTVDFALGAAVPLLVFALAGRRVADRVRAFRAHAVLARRVGGLVLLLMAGLIYFNVTNGLQTVVPGYTSVLQRNIEGGGYITKQLAHLTKRSTTSALAKCAPSLSVLEDCGRAPAFKDVTAWLNTPGDRPLTLAGLRGKVVLVDFWTYSCINCQRSLPHVEAWYARYHADGLEVVGVHTPEFGFEHVVSNVQAATRQLGVDYPVAVDDDYGTWDAYDNEYWPAEYLIDAHGAVRHEQFGEGDYGATESLIRQLLVQADPTVHLPRPTDVADVTPTGEITPESYLGYAHGLPNFDGSSITPGKAATYQFPSGLPTDYLAFAGTWTIGSEEATAGADARIELAFEADDVYLVLGGTGTVGVSVDGTHTRTVAVSGIPRLYTMVRAGHDETGTLVLSLSPGVEAYDFTFG